MTKERIAELKALWSKSRSPLTLSESAEVNSMIIGSYQEVLEALEAKELVNG